MFVIKLHGGLGNQMFQYAFGKSLLKESGVNTLLDNTHFLQNYGSGTKRDYKLNCFDIKIKTANPKSLYLKGLGGTRTMAAKAVLKMAGKLLQPLHNVLYIKEEKFEENYSDLSEYSGTIYLDGYWQNPQYFQDIRESLLKEFTLANKSEKCQKLKSSIRQRESVIVQVRRGDYVSDQKTNSYHGVMEKDFYKKAVDYIKSKVNSPVFYISSNDPAWCKKHIAPLVKDSKIIFLKDRGLKDYQEMMIAKHARHFIISNSTYGWWPAWLSENPDKIIIAPEQWYANKEMNQQCKIKPKSWIEM